MLENICKFLEGLGNVDNGVESVLTETAYDGFVGLVRSVYGNNAAEVVGNLFTQREDGSLVCSVEEPVDAFLSCLNGIG